MKHLIIIGIIVLVVIFAFIIYSLKKADKVDPDDENF